MAATMVTHDGRVNARRRPPADLRGCLEGTRLEHTDAALASQVGPGAPQRGVHEGRRRLGRPWTGEKPVPPAAVTQAAEARRGAAAARRVRSGPPPGSRGAAPVSPWAGGPRRSGRADAGRPHREPEDGSRRSHRSKMHYPTHQSPMFHSPPEGVGLPVKL
jgi:hypothetical protein